MRHLAAIPPQIFWPYFTAIAFTLLAAVKLARDDRLLHSRQLAFALGPICLAIPMAVFGADHLSDARDIMRIVPAWLPGKLFWTYFVGVCLIAAALSIILRIRVRLSSLLLGTMLLSFVLLIHIPAAWAKPGDRMRWIYAARDLAFACGCLMLGMVEGKRARSGERLVVIMQYLVAGIAVFFGIESLGHPANVAAIPLEGLTPGWMPLGPLWTSVTGVGLILGGIAMFVPQRRQMAASALGVLVLLTVLLLYVPMMIAKPDVDALNYVFDTLVFAGAFFVAARATSNQIPSARYAEHYSTKA